MSSESEQRQYGGGMRFSTHTPSSADEVGSPRGDSPVLTANEAAAWLRLDDGCDVATARRAVLKLAADGRLRPLSIGRRRLFTLAELHRFIDAESGASDYQSDGGDE